MTTDRANTAEGRVDSHELKAWPEPFDALLDGRKRFEIRKNDRGFALGGELRLREWDPGMANYTGRWMTLDVVYFTQGEWGLPGDLCVMGVVVTGYGVPAPTAADDVEGCDDV